MSTKFPRTSRTLTLVTVLRHGPRIFVGEVLGGGENALLQLLKCRQTQHNSDFDSGKNVQNPPKLKDNRLLGVHKRLSSKRSRKHPMKFVTGPRKLAR